MADVTKLLPVGVQLHGEGTYLVKKEEYEAREMQVYALAGMYDDAREKALEDRRRIIDLQRQVQAWEAKYEALRGDILRRLEA